MKDRDYRSTAGSVLMPGDRVLLSSLRRRVWWKPWTWVRRAEYRTYKILRVDSPTTITLQTYRYQR